MILLILDYWWTMAHTCPPGLNAPQIQYCSDYGVTTSYSFCGFEASFVVHLISEELTVSAAIWQHKLIVYKS